MKLSVKGLKKIQRWQDAKRLGHAYPVDEIEFEPDDFQGVVCLTVEEAEKLMKLLDLCEYWLMKNSVSYDCDAWASLLEERIEQAEMSMQSTQCENVSKKDEKIITLSAEQAEGKK